MTSSARRDAVRELALLARAPEPGTSNLGEFVADHADELAQALDVDPHKLALGRALDDEELMPRILQLLERARGRKVREDLDRRRERSIAAAHLGRGCAKALPHPRSTRAVRRACRSQGSSTTRKGA